MPTIAMGPNSVSARSRRCNAASIDGTQHRLRQGVENRPLKGGNRRYARMLSGARATTVLIHDDQVDSVSQFLRWLHDAYLNQISFHVPFVVSRPREFLPP